MTYLEAARAEAYWRRERDKYAKFAATLHDGHEATYEAERARAMAELPRYESARVALEAPFVAADRALRENVSIPSQARVSVNIRLLHSFNRAACGAIRRSARNKEHILQARRIFATTSEYSATACGAKLDSSLDVHLPSGQRSEVGQIGGGATEVRWNLAVARRRLIDSSSDPHFR